MSLEQVNVDGNWVEVKLFLWHCFFGTESKLHVVSSATLLGLDAILYRVRF